MKHPPEHDAWVKELLDAELTVKEVITALPAVSQSAAYRKARNLRTFGSVNRPKEARKQPGTKPLITAEMEEWLVDLLARKSDLWQEEMISELFHEFGVLVSQQTMSKAMKRIRHSKKVATRIAAQRDQLRRAQYEAEVRELDEEMLVFVDETHVSEKTLFRKKAWAPVGLPAITESPLRNATRCSILPAYTVDGYIYRTTLVVEGSVTGAIFEDWLEHRVLPQCEPFPGRRSVLVLDNCSTHHGERMHQLCEAVGVRLMYLPAYSPDYNPIELTFHLFKQWLRRHRDLAPQWGCENYTTLFIEHLTAACEQWGIGVDHRALFRKARVRIREE